MPWQVANIMEKRIEFVVRSQEDGVNFSALCREYGISRPTGYRWKSRYQEVGSFTKLKEHSRRPHTSPNRTAPKIETQVIQARDEWGEGAKKLQVKLAAKGIHLPWITIHRILKRSGKVSAKESERKTFTRFEREQPNELWQMDFKGEYPLGRGHCYPLSILDDHSRYVVGLYALRNQKGEGVWSRLVQTFERYGVPYSLLLDHGTPWWCSANGHGLTWVVVKMIQQGIHLCRSRVKHPQTQGKVERFHRSLKDAIRHKGRPTTFKEWQPLLDAYRTAYNEERPHEALQMTAPSLHYSPSLRAYSPNPPEWNYPSDAYVTQITPSGWMNYKGYTAFVCEALAGERVQVLEVDRLLLVQYRHLFIREIDQTTNLSHPLILEEQTVNQRLSSS